MITVVTGGSGSGKSTVGRLLAERIDCRFLDANDCHPPANVAKMATGSALEDPNRWPWLTRLNAELRAAETRGESAVLACSALKRAYRERLASGLAHCGWAFVDGSAELIRSRIARRHHRYMPASLLESQFAALERPQGVVVIDVAAPPQACVEAILASLGTAPRRPEFQLCARRLRAPAGTRVLYKYLYTSRPPRMEMPWTVVCPVWRYAAKWSRRSPLASHTSASLRPKPPSGSP
ncbi:MAG TPA: gluconokinase [Burkholderiales bacterium]|nr:gluconokinase [Burkholderiales bacterium]